MTGRRGKREGEGEFNVRDVDGKEKTSKRGKREGEGKGDVRCVAGR